MSKRKQKGRNVTVYVPDETAGKMEELREVNWSQICKAAIESYIEARKSVNPAIRLKLNEKKQAEEKDGYIFGSQLAPEILKELSYDEVYHLRWDELDERDWEYWFDGPTQLTDWLDGTFHGETCVTKEDLKKRDKMLDEWASKKGSLGWLIKLAESKKGIRKNPQFFNGMIEALREMLA